jgi:hypothetical protein
VKRREEEEEDKGNRRRMRFVVLDFHNRWNLIIKMLSLSSMTMLRVLCLNRRT